ncbi:FUSC family protein [Streptomyces sp. NPDC048270]|uniref:FUSC family protein n=1 Tax=Streptomyces sp. NPDC048270 TaxID=3154615 RepID=UPI0033E57107
MSGMSVPARSRLLREQLGPAARLVVCAALPWYVCVWLGTSTIPVPAALPAVLILRGDVFAAPRLALERLLGVVVGVGLSVVVLHWLPTGPLSFPVLLVTGCAGMYLLRHDGSPNQQVLVTALVIYATPVPGYPLARLWESAVGIAVVALLGPLLWPPDPYREAADGLEEYRAALRARLEGVAALAAAGRPTGPAPAHPPAPAESFALWHRPYELSAALEHRPARLLPLPPRRPPAGSADALRLRLRLAARTAPALYFLTRELEARSAGGADGPVRAMAPLVEATASALDAALRGEDCAQRLRPALELEADHRAAHPGPGDAALRAGIHLTHEALAEYLEASAG